MAAEVYLSVAFKSRIKEIDVGCYFFLSRKLPLVNHLVRVNTKVKSNYTEIKIPQKEIIGLLV